MTEFSIKKDQVSRLKVLLDYIKRVETFSPINARQVFTLEKDKLNIYGISSNGQVSASFDIKSTKIGNDVFEMGLNQFITNLEKIKSDEINIKIENDKMTTSSTTSKVTVNQVIITSVLKTKEITEIKNYINDILTMPEFSKPIEINVSQKDIMTELGNLTKFQDINHQIMLDENNIKTADNICILNYKSTSKIIQQKANILIDRDIMPLFKNVEQFQISSDNKYFYFDIQNYGIKIIFTPRTFNWSFPTDDELNDIIPDNKNFIELEIDSKLFYDKLSDFDGVFESNTWKYNQVKMHTPKGFTSKKEIKLHFDNGMTEVITHLPVEIKSNTDGKEDFEFLIPTCHFKFLKDILLSEDTFKLHYSSKDINDPNGLAIKIYNKISEIIMAKILT